MKYRSVVVSTKLNNVAQRIDIYIRDQILNSSKYIIN